MLDIKRIRENPQELKEALKNRNMDGIDVDGLLALDEKRRASMAEVEALKAERNKVSGEIPKMKKAGEDTAELMARMKGVSDQIKTMDEDVRALDEQINDILLSIPNYPDASVPVGKDEKDNPEIRRWGEAPSFDFEPKAHWDIGTDLNILDFETAAKITGARFTLYRNLGARLERAIINYFLDTHTQNGFTEMLTPFMANTASMTGTGQLPKFAEDMFHVENTDFYMIPTSEVTMTNMYRGDILSIDQLPLRYCAYSACFRAEAGSAGRDTRGLIRQHQFNKVEMVKFSAPEDSFGELESMTAEAERVLQGLGLPHRTVLLCTGDMGFSSAKTYDIEVWMPSYGRYVEISSCSNCTDIQARRAGIRFRREAKGKTEFLHTLNGSGVAVGRTVAAVLENYQQADGSVKVPEALIPYMGCDVIR